MISFKEFLEILDEKVGDFGNPPLRQKVKKGKCGYGGTTKYMIQGEPQTVCKFKRKR